MTRIPFSTVRKYILMLAFAILIGGIGFELGLRSANSSSGIRPLVHTTTSSNAVDFSLFWDVWEKINANYVDPKAIDTQKLVYGAISGMVAAVGDPFTSFFPPQQNTQFKEDLGGAFEGIGAQLGLKDGRVIIVTPLRGSPAEQSGLLPNDYILKVDGADTAGWTVEQAVSKIRGKKGTAVTLSILHTEGTDGPTDVKITRSTITVPSVTWWIKKVSDVSEVSAASQSAAFRSSEKRIAYIGLSRFGDTTNTDWDKAVAEILAEQKKNPITGLVFDLRNNPGGYLEGAVYIASEFLRTGPVVSQVNSDGSKEAYPLDRTGKLLDIPLVVLVNKGSASASEIVSGALHDAKRATLIGETTFGKGTVQTPYDLAGGSSVHITTGKWLLPSGASISQKGITPDIEVSLPLDRSATNDAQLSTAIATLLR